MGRGMGRFVNFHAAGCGCICLGGGGCGSPAPKANGASRCHRSLPLKRAATRQSPSLSPPKIIIVITKSELRSPLQEISLLSH